jgi:hypothetical protein
VDAARLTGAHVRVVSGAATGRSWYCFMVVGDVLVPSGEGAFFDPSLVEGLAAGDTVHVDNHDVVAFCSSDRHYRRDPLVSGQFEVRGVAVYPLRPDSPELLAASGRFTGRSIWSGRFGATKMILQQHVLDRICMPPVAVGYHRAVAEHLGERTDDQFRIWWTEHAQHGPTLPDTPDATRAIDYSGLVGQGLRDMIAWVEEGRPPAPTTSYEFVDGQVLLPPDVDERGGIQPMVTATANGEDVVTVAPGTEVELAFAAAVPTGHGTIVAAEWDLDGTGTFPARVDGIDGTQRVHSAGQKHAYSDPGTHFATVRVWSHRDGDVTATTERIPNLARVRVVVS